jgi:hypothetical protein
MADPKTCTYGIDCPRPANAATGRCDLHDAIEMAEEARDLLWKVLAALDRIARKDREASIVEHRGSHSVIPPGSTGRDPAVLPQGTEGLSECSSKEDQCSR